MLGVLHEQRVRGEIAALYNRLSKKIGVCCENQQEKRSGKHQRRRSKAFDHLGFFHFPFISPRKTGQSFGGRGLNSPGRRPQWVNAAWFFHPGLLTREGS